MSEPAPATLHLPWLNVDLAEGSVLEELRVWQHENWRHAVGDVAAAVLVIQADGTEAYTICHERHGHPESAVPYGGTGRDAYLSELEALWVAFNHDPVLVTDDLAEAVETLKELDTDGAIDDADA